MQFLNLPCSLILIPTPACFRRVACAHIGVTGVMDRLPIACRVIASWQQMSNWTVWSVPTSHPWLPLFQSLFSCSFCVDRRPLVTDVHLVCKFCYRSIACVRLNVYDRRRDRYLSKCSTRMSGISSGHQQEMERRNQAKGHPHRVGSSEGIYALRENNETNEVTRWTQDFRPIGTLVMHCVCGHDVELAHVFG